MQNTKSTRRFERKFTIPDASLGEVETRIKVHPAFFQEIYHERVVNNLYFDTIDLYHYASHVAGSHTRSKVRIRWYGETFGHIINPVLEIKIKQGEVGTKKTFPLPAFKIESYIDPHLLNTLLTSSPIPAKWKMHLKDLRPVLLNTYHRSYWMSSDKSVRLTVDSDWVSYNVDRRDIMTTAHVLRHRGVVLELKYSIDDQEQAARLGMHWPWRMARNSKYIVALESFLH